MSTKTVLQTKEGPYKPANPLSIKLVQQTKEVPYKPANPHCPVKLVHQDSPANKGRAIQASKSSLSSQACPPRQSCKQRKGHTSQQIVTVQSSLFTKTVLQTKEGPYKPANRHCPVKLVHQDRPANKGSAIKASKSLLSSQACPPRQSCKQRKGHTSQPILSVFSSLSTNTDQQTKEGPHKPANPHCPVNLVK